MNKQKKQRVFNIVLGVALMGFAFNQGFNFVGFMSFFLGGLFIYLGVIK